MKIIILSLFMTLCVFAQNLTLKEGLVAAHTEMLMDATIDPLNTFLNADVSINQNDILSLRGKFWIEMGQFSSDNKDRDEYMHEANKINEFPLANFTLMNLTQNEDKTYTIKGNLEFLGVVKPLEANAEIIDKDNEIKISVHTQIHAKDFDLEMPCIIFMCVDEKIDIFVKAVFIK